MGAIAALLDQESTIAAHVGEWGQPFVGGSRGQARHAVLENPAIEVFDRQFLAGAIRRFEILADAERAIGIDAPRKLNPELILLPDFAEAGRAMRFVSGVELPPIAFV